MHLRSGAGRFSRRLKSTARRNMDTVRHVLFQLQLLVMKLILFFLLIASLKNVDLPSLHRMNKMESYFLAETLKYLYLLFDPGSEIDVLNMVGFLFPELFIDCYTTAHSYFDSARLQH